MLKAVNNLVTLLSIIFLFANWAVALKPQKMSAQRLDDRIIIRVNDQTLAVYRFGAGQKYPYFYPVNGPLTGLSLTTESALPYPHHRSLFFGCDKVNDANYWQEGNDQGQIVSGGARIVYGGPDYITLVDECEWKQPGRAPILADAREIRILVPSDLLRIMDFRITLRALTDVTIKRTNHSLFSARMDPSLAVNQTGTLVNAEGKKGEKETYGATSPWCDYSGVRFGIKEGLAIFDSPANPWFPSRWFTRDYGFFSPTPFEWIGEEGFHLPSGTSLTLRYRVVLHAGDAEQAGIARLFEEWAAEEKLSGVRK
jgi:hypothetical protein